MPRTTKNSAHVTNTSVLQENSNDLQENSILTQHSLSSDQKMEVQSPQCFQPSTSKPQFFMQPMLMSYIEGPKMEWTVNDSLYHKFLKWKL